MKKVSVQAYEDRSRPEGGHAVVLLQGLDSIPTSTTFRIRPADSAASDAPPGWPDGEHDPVLVRSTADGTELVIGPDVANNEFLVPGMVVELELPSVGASGTFLWPNIAPLRLPKRSKLGVSRQRRATPTETPAPPASAAAAAAVTTTVPTAPEGETHSPTGPGEEPAIVTSGAPQEPEASPAPAPKPQSPSSEHEADWPAHGGEVARDLPARPNISRSANGSRPASHGPAGHHHATHVNPAPQRHEPRRVPPPRREEQHDLAPTDAKSLPPAPAGKLASGWIVTIAIAAAALGAVASAVLLSPERLTGAPNREAPTPLAQQAPPPAAGTASAAAKDPGGLLFDALSAGTVSPRGVNAAGLPLAKILDNVTSATPSGTAAETEESAFWRKRYIAGALGDDKTLRALTQLGSVYAEPTGRAADYTKARLMWEIASALGDPVAMCFLGQLHENGLGVASDRKAALQWYERAKQAGGCPAVNEAIARVRQ